MSALIALGGRCKYTPELFQMVEGMSPVIAADRGYLHCRCLDIIPDHLAGDMDSIPNESLIDAQNQPGLKISRFNRDKDMTDSEIAIDIALAHGCDSICFIGAFGERLDHMFANQMTAVSLAAKGINCIMTDGVTYMYTISPDNSPFNLHLADAAGERDVISIVPVTEGIDHITIKGLKYALNNDSVPFGSQRAVSNTHVTVDPDNSDTEAIITISNGVAILIHTIGD